MLWSSPEYKAIRRAMQLRRNRLVFRASYGQLQFSTMTEGRHNQWAGLASKHLTIAGFWTGCPRRTLVPPLNNGAMAVPASAQALWCWPW